MPSSVCRVSGTLTTSYSCHRTSSTLTPLTRSSLVTESLFITIATHMRIRRSWHQHPMPTPVGAMPSQRTHCSRTHARSQPLPVPASTAGPVANAGCSEPPLRNQQVFTATVHLTANHMGWFEFRLCPSEKPGQYVKQSCLNKHVLKLVDYSGTRYKIKHSKTGLFRIRLQLPESVTCSRCVVQWHYTTGNNWGFCKDGSNQPGCGPQEVFRGCSDVAVFAPDDPALHLFSNLTREADLSQFLHLSEDEAPPPAPPRTNAHRNDEPDAAFDPVLVFDGEEHFADDDDDALAGQGHRAPGANDLLKAAGPSGAAKQPSITFVEEAKGGGAVASARPRPPPSTPGHQAPRLLRRGAGRAAAAQEVRVVRRLPQEPAGDPHRGRALPLGAHALLPLAGGAARAQPRRPGRDAEPPGSSARAADARGGPRPVAAAGGAARRARRPPFRGI
ncbi:hypothetical protein C7M84_018996 [Penaeus vannamei]|uniref:Chitin-binding type-4 domain-containing protein n=1 Tax=Penaeus vannamei TaxID=6689 RepID=A0A3R7QCA1_PENVA|nr:hypothetical protein C7M84_018996 [Penaeus vannamei]